METITDRNEQELEDVLKEVKEELQKMFTKKRVLIKKLGEAYENTGYDVDNVCQEVKNVLRNEIAQGLITRRLIEEYCLDKWKKKTKPKIEGKNEKISFPEEKIAQPMIIETSGRVIPEAQNLENRYNGSNPITDLETEEIELDYIESCHIKNLDLDKKYSNNKEQLEFEISIPFRLVRKHILVPLSKQIGAKNFLVHGIIDNKTSKLISAWVTGIENSVSRSGDQ